MRPYEVVIIFDASLDESVIRETTDSIVEFVRSRGGTPGHIDRWGRRPFAYELKHRTEGNYIFIDVDAEPALLAEVDRMLSLSDEVLRHRVLRRPEGTNQRQRPPASRPAAHAAAPAAAAPAAAVPAAEAAPAAAAEPVDAPVE